MRPGSTGQWLSQKLNDGELEVEHESKTCLHPGQSLRWHFPRTFLEVVPIDGHELCDVRHGVPRKPACLGPEKHVAGSVEKARVRGDDDPNHRPKPAPVECVGLEDQDRMPKTRLRSPRFG